MDTYDEARGEGWLLFAGVMILIAGGLNSILGIAAIADSRFFTDSGHYVILTNLSAWGWVFLIIGIMQLFAAFSIWSRNPYGRWIGVITASLNAMAILFTVNAFPFGALMIFIIDVLVIYGLVAYGGREPDRGRQPAA